MKILQADSDIFIISNGGQAKHMTKTEIYKFAESSHAKLNKLIALNVLKALCIYLFSSPESLASKGDLIGWP